MLGVGVGGVGGVGGLSGFLGSRGTTGPGGLYPGVVGVFLLNTTTVSSTFIISPSFVSLIA